MRSYTFFLYTLGGRLTLPQSNSPSSGSLQCAQNKIMLASMAQDDFSYANEALSCMHPSQWRVAESLKSFPTSRKAVMCRHRHCVREEQGSETLLTSVAKTRALLRMTLAKAWRVREASHCLIWHSVHGMAMATSLRNRNLCLGQGLLCRDESLFALEVRPGGR